MTLPRKPAEALQWFRSDAKAQEIAAALEAHGPVVETLRFDCNAFFKEERYRELDLPKLRDLAIGSLDPLKDEAAWNWLYALPSLERLQVANSGGDSPSLGRLGDAPWWTRLTYFEAYFRSVSDSDSWGRLWNSAPLSLQTLCLRSIDTPQAIAVIAGKLPNLEYLILGYDIQDSFLSVLAQADLPELKDVELRFLSAKDETVREFIEQPRPGLPKLARVGWKATSDRRVDYFDWNGAVVDWGYEPMSDSEIRAAFFSKSELKLLPLDHDLAMKFDSNHAASAFGRYLVRPKR